jgi:hypothetical protein
MGFSAASAQPGWWGGYGHGYHPPYYGGGSTEGAWRHGFADIVRSAGAYNLMTSEALVNVEEARKKNIENRLQWTQTYFEMRRINDEYRRAQYPRYSAQALAGWAASAATKRLTSSQLDPITGYLAWPRLLLTPDFADLRRDLDRLFAERATSKGAIGNDAYFQILDRADQMKERLRTQADQGGADRGLSRRHSLPGESGTRGSFRGRVRCDRHQVSVQHPRHPDCRRTD